MERVESPVSGKIVEVNVKEGDEVKIDDVIIVMESMKMETPIFSPADGVVKEIKVKANDNVDEEDLLIILE